MLILSRRSDESVTVGDPAGVPEKMFKVTVLEIRKSSVLLGFQAAQEVPIHRSELLQRVNLGVLPREGPTGPEPPLSQ